MGHKFKAFRQKTPKEKESRCPICWQPVKEEDRYRFQGKDYHKNCYEMEKEKPINERFQRRQI